MSSALPPSPNDDPVVARDDVVAAFQLEGRPVRGRVARLGPVVDDILGAHAYPEPVARLLGEALVLATLVGASLKFDGRLVVQASGEGPVSLLVAHYETEGALRGFAKFDPDRLDALLGAAPRPSAQDLLGAGRIALTIDQGPQFNRYQSLASLDGASLAHAAQTYFETSEQVPTRVRLAVGAEQVGDAAPRWRAGGVILQQIAGDEARGETGEAWANAAALFDTLEDVELLDPAVSVGDLLFRLYHEEGVRLFPGADLTKRCACTPDRIARVLASFPQAEIADMTEDDGRVRVTCEYCNRDFRCTLDEIAAAG